MARRAGEAEAVNAVLARPAVLSFDHHYRDVLAPPKGGPRIELHPGAASR